MTRNWRMSFLLLFSAAVLAGAGDPSDFSQLSFLTGVWVGQDGNLQMEEHWTSASGEGLVGMHKDVKDGVMVGFEFFRIAKDQRGTVTYFASPGGAPATPFRLRELAKNRAVFENLDHDFPQRLLYWLEPDGRLGARVEGMIGGELRAQEWKWAPRR